MKNFIINVFDLIVFDYEGKLITNITTATESKLVHNLYGESSFLTTIPDFDIELYKSLGDVIEVNKSDFEMAQKPKSTRVKFKPRYPSNNRKLFKLIAKGELYGADGKVTHRVNLIINKATLASSIEFGARNDEVSTYTHAFRIETDEQGYVFDLELIDID